MEKKEAPEEGSLFASEDPKSKPTTRPNPMLHPMTNADDYKRKRDEDAELFRKKHREQIFKSKRMYEEEQPSLEIPDVGPKAPEHHVQPMVEPGKVPTTEAPVSLADLPAIIQEFYSPAPETCLVGLKKLRRLLSTQGQTPVQEVLDLGVLPRLLELLKCTDKQQIQFEAAWCITNIATGNEAHVMAIVSKHGIDYLGALLQSPHRTNQEQAIWALGNIAGENFKFRDMVLESGVLKTIIHILQHTSIYTVLKSCVWCIANMCRGHPQPPLSKAVKALAGVIGKQTDAKLIIDACWALYYIVDGGGDRIGAIIKSGVLAKLVQMMLLDEPRIALPALRVVGNVTTGSDEETQKVMELNGLATMRQLLFSKNKTLRKESCWAISNIAAGSQDQLLALLKADILPAIANIIRTDIFEVKREAYWVVCNVSSKMKTEQTGYVVSCGIVEALCERLDTSETKSLAVVLQSITHLLKHGKDFAPEHNEVAVKIEACGGVTLIEGLQNHPNQIIYKMAADILEKYYAVEDVEEILSGAGKVDQDALSIFKF